MTMNLSNLSEIGEDNNDPKTIDDIISLVVRNSTRGAGGLYSYALWLTPAIAKILMEHNPHNRDLSDHVVDVMSQAAREGRWKANGNAIVITDARVLGDGQHRCEMVIRTGISIPVVLVYGVADDVDVLATVDQLRPRTVRDICKMARIENAPTNDVIAVSNLITIITDGVDINTSDRPGKAKFVMANVEDIGPWTTWARAIAKDAAPVVSRSGPGTRSVGITTLAALAYHLDSQGADIEVINEFYQGVIDPWGLSGDEVRNMTDNRRELLQALHRHTRQVPLNRVANSFRPLMTQFATHIQAYNRYVLNEPVKLIRSPKGDFRFREDLPRVIQGPKR